jgi:hypothetical protein
MKVSKLMCNDLTYSNGEGDSKDHHVFTTATTTTHPKSLVEQVVD